MTDRTAPRPTVSVERHNAVLDAATARAEKLVDRLAAAVRPILEEAGVRAARAFEAKATDFLTAAGPGVTSASTMVCVKPRPEEAAALALPGGLDAETLHVTLAYLGEVEGDLAAVVEALAPVAASLAPLEGIVGGAGYFGDGTEGPAILLPDVPGLVELRVRATEALAAAEIEYGRDHGVEAHITVAYFDETTDDVADPVLGGPLHFDSLLVVRGDVVEADLPLVGIPAVTAAGQPPWSAPGADEVVDVDSLVAQIRAKTDPVRNAMLETTMTPALRQAGLGFDVTNPLTSKVLAQSGSQVTNIAETTQLNVMRTIRASYANGLSIPQTADVIRAGMAAAAGPRATLIARTELAGVVNGGSLAATKIVAGATGDSYVKKWLTAPGAPNPRHELVDGLDGQTQPLDGYFDVEGSQLEYPGDPGGPPEEVCNCRCGAPWVAISGRAWAASRRVYEGQLVRVVTAGGRELAVTPNHPILTGRGWVAAGLLEEGDDLVCRRHSDIPSGCPDVDDVPAEAQERFASLQLAATRREWVSGGAMNFHGDVAEGEVEVVGADDALPLEDVSPLGEHLRELALSLAHREMGLDGYASALLGDPEAKTVRLSAAAPLNTRPLDDPRDSPSSDAEATREREFALACSVTLNDARSDLSVGVIEGLPETVGAGPSDTAITEILPYGHRSEAALVCDLLVAHSRFVELDPVIDLSRIDYAGHVFNFSTKTGTYLMGGIVSANCTLVYDTPDGEQEADAEEPPDLSSEGDGVSVGAGPPVPAQMVARVAQLGLDRPLDSLVPSTATGRRVYAAARDTRGLFKQGGEWTEERKALHDQIVAAHFEGKVAAEGTPTSYFTAGGGASGKSAALFDVGGKDVGLKDLGERSDVVHIDPDRIKLMLPEYKELRDENDLYAASGVHEESSEIAKRITAEAQARGLSTIVDTTGSSAGFVQKLEAARAAGYDVRVTMFSTPTNEAIVRSMARGDRSGRYVSIEALKKAHKGASQQLGIWKDSPGVKEWRVYDNSGASPELVAQGHAGQVEVLDQQKFDAILAKGTEGPSSASSIDAPTSTPPTSTDAAMRSPLEAVRNDTSNLDPSGKDIDAALAKIDSVMQLPAKGGAKPLVTASVKAEVSVNGRAVEGVYRAQSKTIEVRRLTADRYEAFVHEYGHFLDNLAYGSSAMPTFATAVAPSAAAKYPKYRALAEWVKTIRATPTTTRVEEALAQAPGSGARDIVYVGGEPVFRGTLEYAVSVEELWARAFVQWMSLRDDRLVGRVAELRANPRAAAQGWYWTDEEFKPVAAAMDAYFEKQKWLIPKG